jgi:glycosyltransferase involved in cell wall biosynthesis
MTDYRPLVSVVIPTYNQSAMLIEAVESALAQTYKALEVLVIDDGSTDDTAAKIAPYVDRGLVHYAFQNNARQAAARNAGIEASSGDLIAFLDHDDLWHPLKLERQVPLFRRESVGLVYCGAREIDLSGKHLWKKGIEKYRRGRIFEALLFDHFITNSSVVIRRSCLRQTGAFSEHLFGVDDIHLWLRICHEFEADFVPDILVSCRNHAANMKKDPHFIPDQRFRALVDIFLRFGLDRTEVVKWRTLNADHQFELGWRFRGESRLRALSCFLRSFLHRPSVRCIRAALTLPLYPRLSNTTLRGAAQDD